MAISQDATTALTDAALPQDPGAGAGTLFTALAARLLARVERSRRPAIRGADTADPGLGMAGNAPSAADRHRRLGPSGPDTRELAPFTHLIHTLATRDRTAPSK